MIKIIVGFSKDQKYSIPDDEAHKAYYLFLNPDKRGIFSNGLALIGKHIQSVEPDYQGTMGWNPTYELNGDDWNEIRSKGIDQSLRSLLEDAKRIADSVGDDMSILNRPLTDLLPHRMQREIREEGMKSIGEI